MTTRQAMHPALGWALLATAVASAWALWWPQGGDVGDVGLVDAAVRAAVPGGTNTQATGASGTQSATGRSHANPEAAAPLLSPAERDPFNATPAPPASPKPAAAAPEAAAPPVAPSPPPPQPPPAMNHRVMGRFQAPSGEWLVFVQDGDRAVQAVPGAALASGWRVESVTARELTLRHELAERPVSLSMSEANTP